MESKYGIEMDVWRTPASGPCTASGMACQPADAVTHWYDEGRYLADLWSVDSVQGRRTPRLDHIWRAARRPRQERDIVHAIDFWPLPLILIAGR